MSTMLTRNLTEMSIHSFIHYLTQSRITWIKKYKQKNTYSNIIPIGLL